MSALRRLAILGFLALPALASASVSVSTAISYNGAYTVSWTDASGFLTHANLFESVNGGAWVKTTVTGTTSKAYTGKAGGS